MTGRDLLSLTISFTGGFDWSTDPKLFFDNGEVSPEDSEIISPLPRSHLCWRTYAMLVTEPVAGPNCAGSRTLDQISLLPGTRAMFDPPIHKGSPSPHMPSQVTFRSIYAKDQNLKSIRRKIKRVAHRRCKREVTTGEDSCLNSRVEVRGLSVAPGLRPPPWHQHPAPMSAHRATAPRVR